MPILRDLTRRFPFFLSRGKAVLEEEKRVIHALRRGVELQDYGSVKGLLAQAERMNLTGEEVKQAQAMRLRIEVSRSSHTSGWGGRGDCSESCNFVVCCVSG